MLFSGDLLYMHCSHLYRWSDNTPMQHIAWSDSASEAAKTCIRNLISLIQWRTYIEHSIFDHNYWMKGLIGKWFQRCHPDTCRHRSANFQQNQNDNWTAYSCQCLRGAPIISKLNCTWPIMNHKTQKDINNTLYLHGLFNPFKLDGQVHA